MLTAGRTLAGFDDGNQTGDATGWAVEPFDIRSRKPFAGLMPRKACYHCKQLLEPGEPHDCWTTTEESLTRELSEDLQDAWERLRETATEFGEQRVYASHKSIMFARKNCYFFVRPKRSALEVCFFLGRRMTAPLIRRCDQVSRHKFAHLTRVTHRDEVEAPLTDWLREAYEVSEALSAVRVGKPAGKPRAPLKKRAPAKKRKAAGKPTRKRTKRKSRPLRRAKKR